MVATAREEKNLMKTMKEGVELGEETKKVKGVGGGDVEEFVMFGQEGGSEDDGKKKGDDEGGD